MRLCTNRALVSVAVAGAIVLGTAAPALAAHDSRVDAKNDVLIAEGNPGRQALMTLRRT